MNKNIFLLWQGQFVSLLGTQAYTIAMMFWLMENTASPILMSLIMALGSLPSLVFGPVAGVLADRCSRKMIIVLCDLIRAIATLLLSILLFIDGIDIYWLISAFFLLALINGTARAFFQPAIMAWLPDLTSKQQLPKTMAFFESSNQLAQIIGQVLAGGLYRFFGAPLLLLFDAISYGVSAFSEFFIDESTALPQKPIDEFKNKYQKYKVDLIAGFHYVKAQKGMFSFICFTASVNFFLAPFMLLLPFYVAEQLQQQAHWYGLLLAAMAVGVIVGLWLSAKVSLFGHRRAQLMFGAMFLLAITLLWLSQTQLAWLALMLLFLVGLSIGLFQLQSMTLLQLSTPSALRGRVMSLSLAIAQGGIPIGLLLGGGGASLTDNNVSFIYCTVAIMIALLTTFICCRSNVINFLFSLPKQA